MITNKQTLASFSENNFRSKGGNPSCWRPVQDASGNVYRKVDGGRLSGDSEQRIHDYTSHTEIVN